MRFEGAVLQAGDHRPGGAAGADHQSRVHILFPACPQARIEIVHEARDIGVVAPEHAVLDPERVDRLHPLGPRRPPVDAGKGRLLVGDRDVAAGKARVPRSVRRKSAKSTGATSIRS